MEIVFLIEGSRACRQCECRTITIIRDTQTRLYMFNRATVSDFRSGATGKAVDQKVLSAEIQRVGESATTERKYTYFPVNFIG
jgi:hypothetical protein